MKLLTGRRVLFALATLVLFVLAVVQARANRLELGDPTMWTGYYLIALMLFLGAFSLRKKLSMVPLGKASTWLRLHVAGGVLALLLYWLHTGTLWPNGVYEQVLGAAFYLVSVTGIVGYVLQRIYPVRLTQTSVEVIYERIPAEIAALREAAEAIVFQCTEETGSDTLARHYLETFHAFFRRPRNFLSHAVGGQRGGHWVRQQIADLRRYLDEAEQRHLEGLAKLAFDKNRIDFHYTAQTIMKGWLLIHLPLSVLMVVLAVWHFILVHVHTL